MKIVLSLLIRLVVIGVVATTPALLAAFIEWQPDPALWSGWSRAFVGLFWMAFGLWLVWIVIEAVAEAEQASRLRKEAKS